MTIEEILAGLEERIDDLVRELLPRGKRVGREWDCRSSDSTFGSVSVVLSGAKRGRVGFWQGRPDRPSENGGDLLHLVAAATGTDMAGAIRWAKAWLGFRDDPEERAERKRRAEERRRRHLEDQAKAGERKRRRACELWQKASPRLRGTEAEVYFRGRGLELRAIAGTLENSLRFQTRLEWWMGATYRNDGARRIKTAPGPSFPAILAAIRDVNGIQTAVHCTFLAPDGAGKAPVDRAKLMFGDVEGGVIRLTKGESGLTPEEAKAAGVSGLLVLAEGIENALTVAIAAPEARAWAATSLSNLARAPVWHPCVSAVIVARDNDTGNDQAILQFERAIAALGSHGKPVAVMEPPASADDVNDLVKGS